MSDSLQDRRRGGQEKQRDVYVYIQERKKEFYRVTDQGEGRGYPPVLLYWTVEAETPACSPLYNMAHFVMCRSK